MSQPTREQQTAALESADDLKHPRDHSLYTEDDDKDGGNSQRGHQRMSQDKEPGQNTDDAAKEGPDPRCGAIHKT